MEITKRELINHTRVSLSDFHWSVDSKLYILWYCMSTPIKKNLVPRWSSGFDWLIGLSVLFVIG